MKYSNVYQSKGFVSFKNGEIVPEIQENIYAHSRNPRIYIYNVQQNGLY